MWEHWTQYTWKKVKPHPTVRITGGKNPIGLARSNHGTELYISIFTFHWPVLQMADRQTYAKPPTGKCYNIRRILKTAELCPKFISYQENLSLHRKKKGSQWVSKSLFHFFERYHDGGNFGYSYSNHLQLAMSKTEHTVTSSDKLKTTNRKVKSKVCHVLEQEPINRGKRPR